MRLFGLSLLGALSVAGAAAAQDELSLPTYAERGLQWERAPSVRDQARQFDVATRGRPGDRGVAEVACTPDDAGRLDCTIVNEDPIDWGYGRAAVNVMERARVYAVDGESPAGRTFAFRLRFGNWPSRYLPDRFHPIEAGLRWTRRPVLAPWAAVGMGRGERRTQRFSCVAHSGGAISCEPIGDLADNDFVRASQMSLNAARIETLSGQSPEGIRFDWNMTLERQTHCGSSRNRRGSQSWSEGANVNTSSDGTVSTGVDRGPAPDPTSRCTAAVVQVGDH